SRRRHTRSTRDWSSDVCSSDLKLPVNFSDSDIADTVWLLQGSRLITDWESRYPSAEALAPLEKRKQSRVAARLLALSQTYGLAKIARASCREREQGREMK